MEDQLMMYVFDSHIRG